MRQAQIRRFLKGGALLVALLGTAPALAAVFALPADGSPVVGTDLSVRTVYEDTLPDLAHRYSLGYYEIIRANPGSMCGSPAPTRTSSCPAGASCPRARARASS